RAPGSPSAATEPPAKVGGDLGETRLAESPTRSVAQFMAAIVDDEGPIHVEEVERRVLDAIGAGSGSKRDAAIEEAVTAASSRVMERRRGDFLWPRKDAPVVPRDRSGLPDGGRRLDYVCDEE